MCIAGTGLWFLVLLPTIDPWDPATVSMACLANGWEGQESPRGHNPPLSCVCLCVLHVVSGGLLALEIDDLSSEWCLEEDDVDNDREVEKEEIKKRKNHVARRLL